MPQFKSSKQVYTECEHDGNITKIEEIDTAKIQHMVSLALADLESAQQLLLTVQKQSFMWSTIYKLHYDALHQLVDSFLRFDYIKINNHQCMFAYLCEKHPELDLDWKFFEKIRTVRNGIQYYGTLVTFIVWKEIEVQVNLYIKTLKDTVEKKLHEQ